MALLDANEQRHPRDGSDADGGGAGSSGVVGRGSVGSCAVHAGSGLVGSGAVGSGAEGSGVVGSGAVGSGADGRIGDDCNCDSDCGAELFCTDWGHCGQLQCHGNGECSILVGFALVAIGPTSAAANAVGETPEAKGWADGGLAVAGVAVMGLGARRKKQGSAKRRRSSVNITSAGKHAGTVSALGDHALAAIPTTDDVQLISAPGTVTGYRGVSYDRDRGVYRVTIVKNGSKRRQDFATSLEAAQFYARQMQAHIDTPARPTEAIDGDGRVWRLRVSPRSVTGYTGVELLASRRGLARPYRARYGKQELGYFGTAVGAAIAYAQFESMVGSIGCSTGTSGDSVLIASMLLGKGDDSNGLSMSGDDMGGAGMDGADTVMPLSWVAELIKPDPDTVGGGDQKCRGLGCSEQNHGDVSCGDMRCGDVSCGGLSCGDPSCGNQGCSGLSGSDLGCGEQSCGELSCDNLSHGDFSYGDVSCSGLSCGDLSCSDLGCGDLGCGGPGCRNLSRGDLSCDDLSCGGLSCSDLGCGDLGSDGLGSGDLELLLGL